MLSQEGGWRRTGTPGFMDWPGVASRNPSSRGDAIPEKPGFRESEVRERAKGGEAEGLVCVDSIVRLDGHACQGGTSDPA
jgi:hypothetical protein